MTEPTNLQRAMWAENALCHFDEDVRTELVGMGLRRVDDLYDTPEDVAKDLICDICHFLNLDERAGCKEPHDIMVILDSAFRLFEEEVENEKQLTGGQ